MPSELGPAQAHITGFWDAVASNYETDPKKTPPYGSEGYQAWVDLIERVLPSPPTDVLDVGTGTGFLALMSAALGHRVTAIDLSPKMLAIAQKMAAGRSIDIRFVEADAVSPPFRHGSFDVVMSRHVLWTLRDAHDAIGSWRQLLRAEGRVVAFDAVDPPLKPTPETDDERRFRRHYTPSVLSAMPLWQVEEPGLVEAFTQAGFTGVTVESREFTEEQEDGARSYVLVATC